MDRQRKSILQDFQKICRPLIKFILWMTCIYWSTGAILKWLEEPTSTHIYFNYGDSEKGIEFPAITFCEDVPSYPRILVEECGLNITIPCHAEYWIGDGECDDQTNTPECFFDGGDCCVINRNYSFWRGGLDYVTCFTCECIGDHQALGNAAGNYSNCPMLEWVGDYYCDDETNIPECNYDDGDCCGPNADYEYCDTCECIDDGIDFGCPQLSWVGDGWCDDLTNIPECNYDDGDCCRKNNEFNKWDLYCNDCECKNDLVLENIHGNATFSRKYTGEVFSELIEECIETNPEINLNHVMSKFDPNVFIHVSIIKDGEIIKNIRHQKNHQTWQSIFHPQHGHCHTFDLKNMDAYKYLPAGYEILFNMKTSHQSFVHEANEMANEYGISYALGLGTVYDRKIQLRKKTISMPKPALQRLPCSQYEYFTCIDQEFHLALAEEYGCKVSILYSGQHLGRNYTKSLPECPNDTTYKVLLFNQFYISFFLFGICIRKCVIKTFAKIHNLAN